MVASSISAYPSCLSFKETMTISPISHLKIFQQPYNFPKALWQKVILPLRRMYISWVPSQYKLSSFSSFSFSSLSSYSPTASSYSPAAASYSLNPATSSSYSPLLPAAALSSNGTQTINSHQGLIDVLVICWMLQVKFSTGREVTLIATNHSRHFQHTRKVTV